MVGVVQPGKSVYNKITSIISAFGSLVNEREWYIAMKKSLIFIPVAITLAFAIFLAGFYLGRNLNHADVQIEGGGQISTTAPGGNATTAPQTRKVNINTADLAELMTIPQIGEVLAQRIIDYRTEHGNFKSISELTKVSGIGEKTLEAIKDYVTVGGHT